MVEINSLYVIHFEVVFCIYERQIVFQGIENLRQARMHSKARPNALQSNPKVVQKQPQNSSKASPEISEADGDFENVKVVDLSNSLSLSLQAPSSLLQASLKPPLIYLQMDPNKKVPHLAASLSDKRWSSRSRVASDGISDGLAAA